jgi:hypothetical protein
MYPSVETMKPDPPPSWNRGCWRKCGKNCSMPGGRRRWGAEAVRCARTNTTLGLTSWTTVAKASLSAASGATTSETGWARCWVKLAWEPG